jgi:hypothetical protein
MGSFILVISQVIWSNCVRKKKFNNSALLTYTLSTYIKISKHSCIVYVRNFSMYRKERHTLKITDHIDDFKNHSFLKWMNERCDQTELCYRTNPHKLPGKV